MMTLLNPLVLFGLIAAAIPILLHLFTLRRLRVVEFSSLRFLKELQRSTVRRIRLRQWLLLLLRTLFIVLLVLAFARPTIQGALGTGGQTHAASTAVILLDDSPSMSVPSTNGVLFEQARAEARRILDHLQEDDDVLLLPFSSVRPHDAEPATHSRASALRQINDASVSTRSATVEDALRAAARALSDSKNFNREIYLLSDLQRERILSTSPAMKEGLFDARTRCFIFPRTAAGLRNVSIQEVRMIDALRELGRPLSVRVSLTNHGSSNVRDHVVSVFLEGDRVAQRGVEIIAGGSTDVDFQITPRHSGFLAGSIEIEDDDAAFDNRQPFSVFIPEALRILLAGAPADLRFLKLAFEARISDSSQPVQIFECPTAEISSKLRSSTDVIVLANPATLPTSIQLALAKHLERGGGILLFPGQQTTPESYRASLESIGFPLFASIERAPASQDDAEMTTDRFDRAHPIFLSMFEQQRDGMRNTGTLSGLPLPTTRMYVRLQPSATATAVISRLDGTPFLLDARVGSGRVIAFSVPATNDWSDFPSHRMFVPLIRRSAIYASRQRSDRDPILVGEQGVLMMEGIGVPMVRISDPAGMEVSAVVSHTPTGDMVRLPSTSSQGLYTIKSGERVLEVLRVIPDKRESDPVMDIARLEHFLDNTGIASAQRVIIEDGADLQRAVTEARFGTELWSWFAVLALLVACIELLVARESRRALEQLEINRYI